MKIYLMTDMEGVCGILNHADWVVPTGRYYADGQQLLANEVNAAADGFFAAGATEVTVVDGHGPGGIVPSQLDRRTCYIRVNWYPFAIDDTFYAAAWVGQHAKAGSPFAHIAHTDCFDVLDETINGMSVGEFGEMVLCGEECSVPSIFAAGDEAFAAEARALQPGIETVFTKRGLKPGSGDECSAEAYGLRNLSAWQMHPDRACELIREGAYRALMRFREQPDSFNRLRLTPPYRQVIHYRPSAEAPATTMVKTHPCSIAALLNSDPVPATASSESTLP